MPRSGDWSAPCRCNVVCGVRAERRPARDRVPGLGPRTHTHAQPRLHGACRANKGTAIRLWQEHNINFIDRDTRDRVRGAATCALSPCLSPSPRPGAPRKSHVWPEASVLIRTIDSIRDAAATHSMRMPAQIAHCLALTAADSRISCVSIAFLCVALALRPLATRGLQLCTLQRLHAAPRATTSALCLLVGECAVPRGARAILLSARDRGTAAGTTTVRESATSLTCAEKG